MSLLMDRVIDNAPHLSGQEFKLLVIMASHARNNPPEYFHGWELLEEAMGWEPGSNSAEVMTARKIQRLINLGYLKRTQQGGMYRYAAYELTFPEDAIRIGARP